MVGTGFGVGLSAWALGVAGFGVGGTGTGLVVAAVAAMVVAAFLAGGGTVAVGTGLAWLPGRVVGGMSATGVSTSGTEPGAGVGVAGAGAGVSPGVKRSGTWPDCWLSAELCGNWLATSCPTW